MRQTFLLDGRHLRDDHPGIGQATYSLARAMAEICAPDTVALVHDPSTLSDNYDLEPLAAAGVGLLSCSIAVRSLAEQTALPRLVRSAGAALFHSLFPVTAYRPGCPLVITLHDLIPWRFPEDLPSLATRLAWRVSTRLAVRRAHLILTCSESSRRDLQAWAGSSLPPIRVTPYAADPRFRPSPRERVDELRQRLGLPAETVLTVGSNKPHKNLPRLLEAWRSLASVPELARWRLVIAGPVDPRFLSPASDSGVITLGPVSQQDLVTLYGAAELFVLPSLWEGFGLPVAEAMACATAVACSDRSSLPEVVGDAARLFDPTDSPSIAAAMLELMRDPAGRARLAERGRERSHGLTWRATAEATLAAYHECLSAAERAR